MSTMYKHWTDLIKPKQLEVEEKTLTSNYGKFYAEPFERGFGQTIGNSLRRIMLSSLMGASIVAVRIKGILHEFSTVPGVTEDVADIILNLKEMRLRLNESEQQTLRIDHLSAFRYRQSRTDGLDAAGGDAQVLASAAIWQRGVADEQFHVWVP